MVGWSAPRPRGAGKGLGRGGEHDFHFAAAARFKRRKLGPALFVRQALSGNALVDAGESAALAPAFVPGNRNAGDGTAGLGENEQFRRFGAGRSATGGEGEEGEEEGEAVHGRPLVGLKGLKGLKRLKG